MHENNQMNKLMTKITLWIRFLYAETQYSDNKTYASFKKHNIFVSERHGGNRDSFFSVVNCSSKSLKMVAISVLFKLVTKLLQWFS